MQCSAIYCNWGVRPLPWIVFTISFGKCRNHSVKFGFQFVYLFTHAYEPNAMLLPNYTTTKYLFGVLFASLLSGWANHGRHAAYPQSEISILCLSKRQKGTVPGRESNRKLATSQTLPTELSLHGFRTMTSLEQGYFKFLFVTNLLAIGFIKNGSQDNKLIDNVVTA